MLTGVGFYSPKPEPGQMPYEVAPKMGWSRVWNQVEVRPAFREPNVYHLEFRAEGIYQIWMQGGYRYYAVVNGITHQLRNPLPDNWSHFMSRHNCDFETVWMWAWEQLEAEFERLAADEDDNHWSESEVADWLCESCGGAAWHS